MSFDPKIRGLSTLVRPVTTPKVEAKETTASKALALGHSNESGFEPRKTNKESLGRAKKGGVTDESIGRSKKGGVTDESIGRTKKGGVTDESIGRSKKGGVTDESIGRGVTDESIGRGVTDESIGRGVTDESIGRTKKGGVTDESIGLNTFDAVRDSLVGPDNDPDRLALRDALFERLETPAYAYDLAAGAKNAVSTLKSHILADTKSLTGAAKEQLSTVMSALDERGLRLLGAAAEKCPQVLTNKDSEGNTLLSNLSRLATEPLVSQLEGDVTSRDLLTSVLNDVVNPNRVDQGDAPTCTVTSMQFELVADEPGEYSRLMADLACNGKAELRGGGSLRLDAHDGDKRALEGRSVSQSLFQTAAMEYANGRDADFDPIAGKSVNSKTGAEQRGIRPQQQANLLAKLFGVKYSTDNLKDEKEGSKVLESLRGFDARGAKNRPIILHIDQGEINHAVTLERVTDSQVYFRDPYGVLRSMPDSLFPKYVMAVQKPLESAIG